MSSIGLTAPRLAGGTICYIAQVIAGALLIVGRGLGLHVAAVATIILFGFLISGVWLVIGIHRERDLQ